MPPKKSGHNGALTTTAAAVNPHSSSPSPPSPSVPVKLLCLHGKSQDRIVMENKCDTLLGRRGLGVGGGGGGGGKGSSSFSSASGHTASLSVVPTYIDAPFMMPKRNKSDEVSMRTWEDARLMTTATTSSSPSSSVVPSSSLLPPFIPPPYAESVAGVLGLLLEESMMNSASPVDVLFGFSEGCIVACYVALALNWFHHHHDLAATEESGKGDVSIFASIRPLKAVVLAAPPPLPTSAPSSSTFSSPSASPFSSSSSLSIPNFCALRCPILVYLGKKDAIVTPAASRRLVRQVCGGDGNGSEAANVVANAAFFEHDGAHMVPYSADAIAATRAFLDASCRGDARRCDATVKEKASAAHTSSPAAALPPAGAEVAMAEDSVVAPVVVYQQHQPLVPPPPPPPPRYRLANPADAQQLSALAQSEAWASVTDEVDVLRSMFGDGADQEGEEEEGGDASNSNGENIRSPQHWYGLHLAKRQLQHDAAAAAVVVDDSLKRLTSVVGIVGGAQCLLERVRGDLDALLLGITHNHHNTNYHQQQQAAANANNSRAESIRIIGQLLVPLATQSALLEACGGGASLLPVAKKALAEMGEHVVGCVTILKGYPNALERRSGGDGAEADSTATSSSSDATPFGALSVVLSIVSGVPRPATHMAPIRALLRQTLPALALDSQGCPSLLQLVMAASEGIVPPLADYYIAGCVVTSAGEAGEAAGGAEDEDDAEGDAKDDSMEGKARRAMLAVWAALEDEEADAREASIDSARKEATRILSGTKDWRRRYCGRQSTAGGTWDLCFGLVGKPSAGKSSIFSAAAKTPAKVGSYPFTTIEPNISPSFAPMLCPCREFYSYLLNPSSSASGGTVANPSPSSPPTSDSPADEGKRLLFSSILQNVPCGAEHSCLYDASQSVTHRVRRQPVLLKDVAGLVKGAYKGNGKGNRFLNDLCDADALIHVVDGAGATNADGWECNVGEGNPLTDVEWVRNEVHSWIFDNVRSKWEVIIRKPAKFREMFSGYRASLQLVDIILSLMGIRSIAEVATVIPRWKPADLHVFVALFLFVRFPMVLAVNKMDLSSNVVVSNGEAIARRNPMDIVVCLSAKEELARNEAVLAKLGQEKKGDADGVAKKDAAAPPLPPSSSIVSFGLQNLLRACVEACLPIAVYPVTDLSPLLQGPLHPNAAVAVASSSSSFQGEGGGGGGGLAQMLSTVLKQCALIRPGTTVESAKASFLNIASNRKLVRIESVPILSAAAAIGPSSPSSEGGGAVTPAPSALASSSFPRKPVLMHPQDEFTQSCFLHVMTNAKA